MKKLTSLYIVFLLTMLSFQGNLKAQVSHGGRPLPLSLMRSTNGQMFKEMPPFDVQEELRIDSLNESDLRSGFRFAYKFITDYNRYNSGVTFTGPDGTRVWRLGIYSPGALSINVLFTEYELPEGAQLFLYNEDQDTDIRLVQSPKQLGVKPIAGLSYPRGSPDHRISRTGQRLFFKED